MIFFVIVIDVLGQIQNSGIIERHNHKPEIRSATADLPLDHTMQNNDKNSTSTREAEVIGAGPRLEPLPARAMSEDLLAMIGEMIKVNEAINARGKKELTDLDTTNPTETLNEQIASLPEIMRTMLRHPELFACQTNIGIQLLGKGTLPARERELAILRIGWLCQAPYEWGEHVHVGKSVGLTHEQIEKITQGSQAPGWNELDQAILQAVEELYSNAFIADSTWAVLEQYFNDQQLIELPILIGQYQTVAYYQNSLRLRLHEGNLGLGAR